ncbi:MAG: hypothetical protein WAM14_09995 [Candidatus Nitrosopolaris sp.]
MQHDAGKNQAYNDFPARTPTNEACPGGSVPYCSGYTARYDSEWATLKQAQP